MADPTTAGQVVMAAGSVREVVLLALLVLAAYTDLARGKVYNWCTLPALVLGALLAYVIGGVSQGPPLLNGVPAVKGGAAHLADSGLGLLVAGGVFGLFGLFGAFGMGDVKLAAAVGVLKGWHFSVLAICFSGLVGGVMALGVLIWKGQLSRGLRDSAAAVVRPSRGAEKVAPDSPARLTVPYGAAISAGTLWAWFMVL